jgi:hypothetical protein
MAASLATRVVQGQALGRQHHADAAYLQPCVAHGAHRGPLVLGRRWRRRDGRSSRGTLRQMRHVGVVGALMCRRTPQQSRHGLV